MNEKMPLAVSIALTLGALALAAGPAAAQQLYRWVDKEGGVHYTQSPPPPGAARSVQKRSFGSGGAPSVELPYTVQMAMRNHPLTLYTSPDCGAACSDGRAYLDKRGVPFKEVSVNDEKSRDELQAISGKQNVPVLAVGRDVQDGFEEQAWKDALDAAGYPASVPRVQQQAAAKEAPKAATSATKLPVSLYTSENCGRPCDNARRVLGARNVEFQEITVDTPEKVEELRKISGETTAPTLVVGDNVHKGFEESSYEKALDAGGYARAASAAR